MSLWSFIEERCKAKGIKPFDLVDAGVSRATLYRIQDGGTPGDRVKAQLSVGLGCSIGEINEAISQADQTTSSGETVKKTKKKESVMETVDKLEEMMQEKPYVTPDPEEAYELTEEEKELNGVESFEELKKKQHPEGGLHLYNVKRPAEEEIDVKPLLLETTAADYQSYLRGQIIKHMMEAEPGTTIEQLWIRIGQMIAKEVL